MHGCVDDGVCVISCGVFDAVCVAELERIFELFNHASWGWCSSCETVLNDLCSVYKILQIPGSIQ